MARTGEICFKSGNYILTGDKTITRADGHTGTAIYVSNGASLTIGGNVAIDGGANWVLDGEPSTPAAGADNTGTISTASLIDNNGTVSLKENAVIRN